MSDSNNKIIRVRYQGTQFIQEGKTVPQKKAFVKNVITNEYEENNDKFNYFTHLEPVRRFTDVPDDVYKINYFPEPQYEDFKHIPNWNEVRKQLEDDEIKRREVQRQLNNKPLLEHLATEAFFADMKEEQFNIDILKSQRDTEDKLSQMIGVSDEAKQAIRNEEAKKLFNKDVIQNKQVYHDKKGRELQKSTQDYLEMVRKSEEKVRLARQIMADADSDLELDVNNEYGFKFDMPEGNAVAVARPDLGGGAAAGAGNVVGKDIVSEPLPLVEIIDPTSEAIKVEPKRENMRKMLENIKKTGNYPNSRTRRTNYYKKHLLSNFNDTQSDVERKAIASRILERF